MRCQQFKVVEHKRSFVCTQSDVTTLFKCHTPLTTIFSGKPFVWQDTDNVTCNKVIRITIKESGKLKLFLLFQVAPRTASSLNPLFLNFCDRVHDIFVNRLHLFNQRFQLSLGNAHTRSELRCRARHYHADVPAATPIGVPFISQLARIWSVHTHSSPAIYLER